eukprot:765103-Hanusia_phi.AAC.2
MPDVSSGWQEGTQTRLLLVLALYRVDLAGGPDVGEPVVLEQSLGSLPAGGRMRDDESKRELGSQLVRGGDQLGF